MCIRDSLYTENDLQRLRFIRYARQLGFTLEAIRELLSIRVDPVSYTHLDVYKRQQY